MKKIIVASLLFCSISITTLVLPEDIQIDQPVQQTYDEAPFDQNKKLKELTKRLKSNALPEAHKVLEKSQDQWQQRSFLSKLLWGSSIPKPGFTVNSEKQLKKNANQLFVFINLLQQHLDNKKCLEALRTINTLLFLQFEQLMKDLKTDSTQDEDLIKAAEQYFALNRNQYIADLAQQALFVKISAITSKLTIKIMQILFSKLDRIEKKHEMNKCVVEAQLELSNIPSENSENSAAIKSAIELIDTLQNALFALKPTIATQPSTIIHNYPATTPTIAIAKYAAYIGMVTIICTVAITLVFLTTKAIENYFGKWANQNTIQYLLEKSTITKNYLENITRKLNKISIALKAASTISEMKAWTLLSFPLIGITPIIDCAINLYRPRNQFWSNVWNGLTLQDHVEHAPFWTQILGNLFNLAKNI